MSLAPPAPRRRWAGEGLLPSAPAWPALGWWIVFFFVPLAWIILYSFGSKSGDTVRGPVSLAHLSFDNYATAASDIFFHVFVGTLETAGLGTIGCLVIGLPVAYTLAVLVPPRQRSVLVFLLVLPYWTSFLLRTFAWRIILSPQGTLSHALRALGVLTRPLLILDTSAAVQLGIIYNYLPMMVLPIYVALERIDPSLRTASMDLGVGPVRTFFAITLPLAFSGILGGMLLTFILASGDYVVPTILGGVKGLMIGNLVATQILAAQDLSLGAAMAVLLIVLLATVIAAAALILFVLRHALRLFAGASL